MTTHALLQRPWPRHMAAFVRPRPVFLRMVRTQVLAGEVGDAPRAQRLVCVHPVLFGTTPAHSRWRTVRSPARSFPILRTRGSEKTSPPPCTSGPAAHLLNRRAFSPRDIPPLLTRERDHCAPDLRHTVWFLPRTCTERIVATASSQTYPVYAARSMHV